MEANWNEIKDKARDQAWRLVNNHVWRQIYGQIWNQILDRVRDEIKG